MSAARVDRFTCARARLAMCWARAHIDNYFDAAYLLARQFPGACICRPLAPRICLGAVTHTNTGRQFVRLYYLQSSSELGRASVRAIVVAINQIKKSTLANGSSNNNYNNWQSLGLVRSGGGGDACGDICAHARVAAVRRKIVSDVGR